MLLGVLHGMHATCYICVSLYCTPHLVRYSTMYVICYAQLLLHASFNIQSEKFVPASK